MIMEDYYGLAVNVARQFFIADPAVDKDDLTQIAAVAIFRAKSRYNTERGEFSTFAHRVARNAIISYLKSIHKHKPDIVQDEAIYNDVSIDEYINDKWTSSEITTMKLRIDGHSIQEIADSMSCSTATVNNRLRKGRERIRKQLN
jgi:RNA polymerase sigma factor (sigma-70 family)